jgi:18S rRNA (adenine1779-N6/adenine1780-N6)-dimethyltransferase
MIEKERKYFKSSEVELKSSYSQHLLKNPKVAKDIVDKSGLKRTDIVLEIGPGKGILTLELLEKAKRVIAVEFDNAMIIEIQRRFKGTNYELYFTLIHADIMKVDLPFFDICVANIPYQLSSPITFKLLSHRPIFRASIIMYQFEFAMCLIAQPGEPGYGRLSANVQLVSRVNFLFSVNKNNFRPVPDVESCVLRLEPKILQPLINYLEWDGLIRICFKRKNKTLGAIFRNNTTLEALEQKYCINRAISSKLESKCCFLNSKRPEKTRKKCSLEFKKIITSTLKSHGFNELRSTKMSQKDFLKLLAEMNSKGIYFS